MRGSVLLRACLLAMLALMMATLQHRLRSMNDPYANRSYDTARIARGDSPPPFQHRVLVPATAVAIRNRLGLDLATVEAAIRFAALAVLVLFLDRLLTRMANPDSALAGCLLLLCLLPLGFHFNPVIDSYPAMCILALGLWLILSRRYAWLLPLVGFGTLIRETPVLLAPISAIALWGSLPTGRLLLVVLGQVGVWAAVKVVLSTVYPGWPFSFAGRFNLTQLAQTGLGAAALRGLTVLGPLVLALCGLRALVPSRLAFAMGIVGLVYGGGLLLVARANEPRAFYEAYLLVVPAMLGAVGLWGGAAEQPDAGERAVDGPGTRTSS